MSVVGSVVANLVANTRQFEQGMARSAASVRQLSHAAQASQTSLGKFDKFVLGKGAALAGLGSALKGFAAGGAAGLALGAAFDVFGASLQTALDKAKELGKELLGLKPPEIPFFEKQPGFVNKNLPAMRAALEGDRKAFQPGFDAFRRFLPSQQAELFSAKEREASAEKRRQLLIQRKNQQIALAEARKNEKEGVAALNSRSGLTRFVGGLFGRDELRTSLALRGNVVRAGERLKATDASITEQDTDLARRALIRRLPGRAANFGRDLVGNIPDVARNAFRQAAFEFDKFGASVQRNIEQWQQRLEVVRELRRPEEMLRENVARLRGLGLDDNTMGRALLREKDRLKGALNLSDPKLAEAFERGSVAAQSAINRTMLGTNENRTLESLLVEAREQTKIQERLAAEAAAEFAVAKF